MLLAKVVVFSTILFICDFVIGIALEKMYFSIDDGTSGAMINHLLHNKYDVYVMGLSLAQHGYIPDLIERETGLSVYNAGEDGTDILYKYAILQLILKTHKPKLIIWDVHNRDYYHSHKSATKRLILPYHREEKIGDLLNRLDPQLRIATLSRIYPYNQKVMAIFSSRFRILDKDNYNDRGYLPLYGSTSVPDVERQAAVSDEGFQTINSLINRDSEEDRLYQQYFHQFITECKDNNIKILAVMPPPHPALKGSASVASVSPEILRELEKYDIPCYAITHREYPELAREEYFKDIGGHLNHSGALVYSGIVAKIIRDEFAVSSIDSCE